MGNTNRGNFIGHDGFVWWIGVIEDRMDPLNLGRCRVRIQGLHSKNKNLIPTNTLPWAQPLFSINGSTSTPSTLKEGDFVMGFFMDGNSTQFPIIMGMFHGIPEDVPDREQGFNDPRSDTELKNAPRKPKSMQYNEDGSGVVLVEYASANTYPNKINQPTTSRLARNEDIANTIIGIKNRTLYTEQGPDGANVWTEPASAYNTKYPYNQVISTESGHYFELDDTPNHERIHLYHRAGTFTETHPDGSQVEKIVKDKYTIIMKDDKVSVLGSCYLTVQGTSTVYIVGDTNITVGGDYTLNVDGDMNINVTGNLTQKGKTINLN